MPNKDGTGPEGRGQRCRNPGSRQGKSGGRGRIHRSSGGRRSGEGMSFGQQQDQDKKRQRNKNQ